MICFLGCKNPGLFFQELSIDTEPTSLYHDPMVKQLSIDLHPFPATCTLIQCPSEAFRAYAAHAFEEVLPTTDFEGAGLALWVDGGTFAIWLEPEATIPDLVHETSHIIDFLFDFVCIPFNTQATELRAYMLGYIVKQALGARPCQ